MSVVLDASALLALIFAERGYENVIAPARGSHIVSVNFSEVAARIIAIDGDIARADVVVNRLEISVAPFDRQLARITAELRPKTSSIGASFADRACLAFGAQTGLPILSADKRWMELDLGLDIRMIR
jgi:PIN domain nuclease of toxin-antitoxin system